MPVGQQPVLQGEFIVQLLVHSCALQEGSLPGQSPPPVQPQKPPFIVPMQVLPLAPFMYPVVQLEQTPPLLPQSSTSVPGLHIPFTAAEQQPPLQALLMSHARPHVWLVQAFPAGQSLLLLQPQLLLKQMCPAPFDAQLTQVAWAGPQLVLLLPAAHTLLIGSQQAPLQGFIGSQAMPHTPPLHACPAGHSPNFVQPQLPALHTIPSALFAQSTQAAPARPQVAFVTATHTFIALQQLLPPQVPAPMPMPMPTMQVEVHPPPLHVGVPPPQATQAMPIPMQLALVVPATQLVPSQQPPLQANLLAHTTVQVFLPSQALPGAQSPGAVQPQAPLTHAWPALDAVQSRQRPPSTPHRLGVLPATHMPEEQQPPLQALVLPLHALAQVLVVRSQACSA